MAKNSKFCEKHEKIQFPSTNETRPCVRDIKKLWVTTQWRAKRRSYLTTLVCISLYGPGLPIHGATDTVQHRTNNHTRPRRNPSQRKMTSLLVICNI